MVKKKRGGRKAKPLKERKAELEDMLVRILRIASVFHNIQRNKDSRQRARRHVRKFEKELKKSRDKGERETLKFLIKDYQSTASKMETFIKEDVSEITKLLREIKLNGGKKNDAKGKRNAL